MSLASQVTALSTRVATECKNLWAAVNGKEPAVAAGTTAQYRRGDKTWQTLNDSHTHDTRYYTEAESDGRFVNLIEVGSPTTFKRARGVVKWSQTGANIAGDLVIQTNVSFGNFMTRLHIQGFNYINGDNNIDLKVAFYATGGATPSFAQYTVQNDGAMPISQVRLMRRTADDLVAIVITSGNASNFWQYPKIAVDCIIGHTAIADSALQGWTTSITSDLTAYTAMVTPAIELPRTTQDALDVNSEALSYMSRAQAIIHGGGTVTVSASYEVKWSARFIVISAGRSATTASNGYFDIDMPPVGTVITGVGGAANQTTTAAGIVLAPWQALYYILPLGSTNPSVAANFRVASYTAASTIDDNWILIAARNGDGSNSVRFGAGYTLMAGDTWSPAGQADVTLVEYTTTVPARPSTSNKVIWQGQVDPAANALAGDSWWPTA